MAAEMRALSIQQPWASAIAFGDKRTENRTWPAPPWIIGQTIALHASKGPDWDAPDKAWIAAGLTPWRCGDPRKAWTASLVLGAVVALAEVTGCHHSDDCMLPASVLPACGRTGCSPWAARGQHHIELAGVRPLAEPVPCKGALGLWRLPEDVERAVRERDRKWDEQHRPSLFHLLRQAGGGTEDYDPERYRELAREHGHIMKPGDEGYEDGVSALSCGQPVGDARCTQCRQGWHCCGESTQCRCRCNGG